MPSELTLHTLGPEDSELLGNLLELYIHDLSAIYPRVELDARGRFGYPPLPAYLSGRSDRFAFSIRCDGRVAGFALAQRGSPVADDPNVLDVAEFFVLKRFRQRGVGRAAAALAAGALTDTTLADGIARLDSAIASLRATLGGLGVQGASVAEASVEGATAEG